MVWYLLFGLLALDMSLSYDICQNSTVIKTLIDFKVKLPLQQCSLQGP